MLPLNIPTVLAPLFTLLLAVAALTSNPTVADSPQSFRFGYTSDSSLILPTIPSCPGTLTIPRIDSMSPPEAADPVAPYTFTMLVHEQLLDPSGVQYERMYARMVNVESVANGWSTNVPWMNGTQMIGCMTASNGVSGGCQDLMTVVSTAQTPAAYADSSSTCRVPSVMGLWVPPASSTLNVKVEHPPGALSSNGWPVSCSDIRVTPLNGTGPYTLLVAPAFHPPLELTGNGAMNYTVRLSHGQAFMLGLFDSAGNSWAWGPLHAGKNKDVSCLGVNNGQTLPSSPTSVGISALAGGAAGAFVLGSLGAALFMWGCFLRKGSRHRLLHDPLRSPLQGGIDPISPFSPPLHRPTSSVTDIGNHLHLSPSAGVASTPGLGMQYDSYMNPKPYDPYNDSPDLTSTHHLSYMSARSADSGTGGGAGGQGELYDPYRGSRNGQGSGGDAGSTLFAAGGSAGGNPAARPRLDNRHSYGTSASMDQSNSNLGDFGEPRRSPGNTSGNPYTRAHAASASNINVGAGARHSPNELGQVRSRSPSSPYNQSQHQNRQSLKGNPYPGSSPSATEQQQQQQRYRSASDLRDRGRDARDRHSRHGDSPERERGTRNVYVVHSDAGPEHDVHIRLPGSDRESRIIEVPPEYRPASRTSGSQWGSSAGAGAGASASTGAAGMSAQQGQSVDAVRTAAGSASGRIVSGTRDLKFPVPVVPSMGAGRQEGGAATVDRPVKMRRKSSLERMQSEYLGMDRR